MTAIAWSLIAAPTIGLKTGSQVERLDGSGNAAAVPSRRACGVPANTHSDTPEAMETNIRSRARARAHLDAGGVIVVFPAGGISTAPDRLGRKPAVDAPWGTFTANLIQRSKAPVVPIWFAGQNSRLFQIASHLSMSLRLSLVFHEVRSRVGTVLPVVIGAPIPFSELSEIKDRQSLMNELRRRTYQLAERLSPVKAVKRRPRPVELAVRANVALKNLIEKKRAKTRKHSAN